MKLIATAAVLAMIAGPAFAQSNMVPGQTPNGATPTDASNRTTNCAGTPAGCAEGAGNGGTVTVQGSTDMTTQSTSETPLTGDSMGSGSEGTGANVGIGTTTPSQGVVPGQTNHN
ncbi:hypothetical protein [Jiella sp. M17.18]|uniref:hypothetical protein n=1 Tax=Jiella sp. M17.18 TaxID=3234247 RepID=UPI0034DFB495